MPASTAHGYPYPVGTDRVADGDNAIQALAEKVEANLVGGVWSAAVTVNLTATATGANQVVTFPAGRFTVAPVVALAVTGPSTQMGVSIAASPSTTNVTVQAMRNAAGTYPQTCTVHVVAHQQA